MKRLSLESGRPLPSLLSIMAFVMAFVCLAPSVVIGEPGAPPPPPPTDLGTPDIEDRRAFRVQFIKNHERDRYKEQVELVRKNKYIIPKIVKAVIEEAMSDSKSLSERAKFLELAKAMAVLQHFWNNDPGPLMLVAPYSRADVQEAEVMRRKFEERFLGNFVMMRYGHKLVEDDLSPVLYPHWLHRIYYECRVCHDSLFKMKRHSNNITQRGIEEGKHCGECHDGTEAFGSKGNCERCHLAGTPDAVRLRDPSPVDHRYFKKTARSLGAEWVWELLPGGELPLDKFRFIDWMTLKKLKVLRPKASLSKKGRSGEKAVSEKRDNTIYFSPTTKNLKAVVFDHAIHTEWVGCDSCHPTPFSEKLGKTKVRMKDFSGGGFCGKCHGQVSFTLTDCKRCHNYDRGKVPEGVLVRIKKGAGATREVHLE